MTFDRVRSLTRKFVPLVLGGIVLGSGLGMVAQRYFASDCCAAGSSCCHPGSSCCHHHATPPGSLAQR